MARFGGLLERIGKITGRESARGFESLLSKEGRAAIDMERRAPLRPAARASRPVRPTPRRSVLNTKLNAIPEIRGRVPVRSGKWADSPVGASHWNRRPKPLRPIPGRERDAIMRGGIASRERARAMRREASKAIPGSGGRGSALQRMIAGHKGKIVAGTVVGLAGVGYMHNRHGRAVDPVAAGRPTGQYVY